MGTAQTIELITGNPPVFDITGDYNRRFMFCRKTGEMILGGSDINNSSHSAEYVRIEPCGEFSDFVRGWIGFGGSYPHGVLHFAPLFSEDELKGDADQLADLTATLEVFTHNGATADMVLRGGGTRAREVTFGAAYPDILSPKRPVKSLAKRPSAPLLPSGPTPGKTKGK